MLIHVGVMGGDPGWQLLLEQEGVPHAAVKGVPSPGSCSVVAASGELGPEEIGGIRDILAGGGALLCSAGVFSRLSGVPSKKLFTRYVIANEPPEFFAPDLVDLFTECEIPPQANALTTDGGVFSAFVGEYGGGHLVVFPFDPAALARDPRVATKSFYAGRKRLPFERISLVAKGGLRRLVSRALAILHHRRGIPYAHLWYHPSGRASLFAFRVDTDYGDRPSIERLSALARESQVPVTWFVDVGSQREFLPLFGELRSDEAGIHCYEHKLYRDPDDRVRDIGRAVEEFGKAGLKVEGYAAPFGRWDTSLAEALERHHVCYSSEFSYDYDNVPSYPCLGERFSATLQVPIHPVSIGSLRRQGFSGEEMAGYFREVIRRKVEAREPVILYHHPNNGHEDVLKEIFGLVKKHGLEAVRMGDYARWWAARSKGEWRIAVEGSTLTTEAPPGGDQGSEFRHADHREALQGSDRSLDERPWLHLVRPDGRESFQPAAPIIRLDELEWRPAPIPSPLPNDVARIRKFNPWIPLIRAEDRVTGLFRS